MQAYFKYLHILNFRRVYPPQSAKHYFFSMSGFTSSAEKISPCSPPIQNTLVRLPLERVKGKPYHTKIYYTVFSVEGVLIPYYIYIT